MSTQDVDNNAEAAMTTLENTPKWVEFQQATFTSWINEVLKDTEHTVENIQTDFRNGLALIALLETISDKKIKGVKNKNLTMNQYQMRENLDICLRFMEEQNFSLVRDIGK